ncbi:ribosomal RNA processing protein 1 homolog B isoform X1 [Mustela nigripes]|uniref:ribosomal RNA processing protein 1 homolog B isoform X1 n=2 Tax=Mustela nigripes TaxID=77151 RepID=UPI002816052B|nr:ribosomal RNA processing protein 1 homolog B isoform X1 [Mustela nigripes]
MAPAMQPAELQFAQRLASQEKGIRERAVRKLRQYLSVKTQREAGGFSQEELLKIWKGLFYCMWVQDEPLLQEELANTISQLVHVVNNSEAQHLFIQTFWQTMNREWKGIDRLRLDKFYMLIRLVLRQSFEVLKRDGWEESRIKLFLDVLMKEILHPESQSPNGVKFHFIGIYLHELSKVGGRELLADQNLKFIDPFCKIAARTKDQTLVQTIARRVLEAIVDQSPFGPEETLEEQRTQVGETAFSAEEMPGNEAAWRKPVRKEQPALGKQQSRKDGVHDNGEPGGRLEDAGPLLQFDYKAVADRLLEITNKKNIPPFNRKRLSKLIKKFRDLSEGSVSQFGFVDGVSADEDDQTLDRGRQKRKGNKVVERTDLEKERGNKLSLAEEEESEASVQKRKRKKKKKKNHLQPEHSGSGPEAMRPEQNGGGEPEASTGGVPKTPVEPGTVATPGPQEQSSVQPTPVHSRRKRPRKRSPTVQGGGVEPASPLPPEDAAPGGPSSARTQALAPGASPAGGAPIPKKRKLGALPVNGSGPPVLAWPLSPGGRLKQKKGEPSSLDLHSPSAQKAAILKKRKRRKEGPESVSLSGVPEAEATLVPALGGGGVSSPSKKRPLRPENDFVRFDTPFLPKPLFFRKAKSSTAVASAPHAMQRDKTPSSSKKVTFGLNRNMTAEFKKTDKSILVSPTGPSRVAFNPEQKPLHGVLKTATSSPTSTPPGTRKLLPATPKRRPTAADFF